MKALFTKAQFTWALFSKVLFSKARLTKPGFAKTVILLLSLGLAGCGDNNQEQQLRQAVAIESGEECHLCGMIITNFPGPKGEIFDKRAEQARKFCSTRDLFSFYLQPENQRQISQIFVHNMTQAPWDAPTVEHFIDARNAWYVAGSSQSGAMGPTLASFAKETDARAFIESYGGRLLQFNDINFEVLAEL